MSEKNRDSPSVSEKRGRKFLHRQSKELLYKLYHFMKKEANEGPISLKQTQVRLSQATGVSCRTIQRALKEVKESNGSSAPRKHRLRKKYKTNLDDFDKSVVRETIYDFHLNHVEHLTLKKLLLILMEKINFKGSISSLRRIIKEMGFQWKKANNDNRKILAEKPAIRELRLSYLRALKHYRKQQRPIVFTDESYINPSDSKHFTYTDGSSVPISKNQRAMIVHAGCEAGLISNALLIFKTEQKPVDDNAMNYAKYEMWVRDKLIPNLPANSVVVMDNASYHNTQMNLAPTFSSRKEEMVEWLINHNIPHSTDMCIPELHKLIQLHKPRYKSFKIDAILAEHGHSVLRLPQYSPELNPIEMVWATAKDYMAQRNVNFNLDDAIRLFEEAINTISNDDWKLKCDQVREIEDSYLHRETLIDITNERLIKPIQIESSTYSGESESNSDTDEESESGEGTDSDSHGMNLFVELFE